MKNLIIVFLIFLFGQSALREKTQEIELLPTLNEIVQNSAEEYLIDLLNDPDSNEIVKLVQIDSVLYQDNIEYRMDRFKDDKVVLAKIDSLVQLMGNKVNDVASYTYVFSFRANNAMGAKVLNEYILQTGEAPDHRRIKQIRVIMHPVSE